MSLSVQQELDQILKSASNVELCHAAFELIEKIRPKSDAHKKWCDEMVGRLKTISRREIGNADNAADRIVISAAQGAGVKP